MTYDRQATYLTWGGSIGASGLDTWQCGVHLALNPSLDGPGLPDATELATLLAGPIKAWHISANVKTSSYCFLNWARAASVDPDGHYTTDPVVSELGVGVGGGAVSVLQGGPQVALAVTLYSGSQLGLANYGRFYSPWNEAQLDGDGKIPIANLPAITADAQTFVQGLNTWAAASLSSTARVRIMSKKGAGVTKRAAFVRVGSVKDTQQRRRRQLDETYDSQPIAP